MKIKLFLLSMSMAFLSISTLTSAGFGTSEGPPKWGPWYLYQSNVYTYTIECVYKRKEIKENTGGGMGSILTETQRLQIARYPFGKCADTIAY